jgi:hypothetical protein
LIPAIVMIVCKKPYVNGPFPKPVQIQALAHKYAVKDSLQHKRHG